MDKDAFEKAAVKWGARLPALPGCLKTAVVLDGLDPAVQHLAQTSWMAARVTDGKWGIGCRVCALIRRDATVYSVSDARAFATFQVRRLKLGNFLRHHQEPCHQSAVRQIFRAGGEDARGDERAPSPESFKPMWRMIRQGHAPNSAIESVGHRQ